MTDQEKIKDMINWYLREDGEMNNETKYRHLSSIAEYAESCGVVKGITKAFEALAKK